MQLMESESFGTGVLSVIHPFAESEEKWQDTTLRRSRDSDARRNNKCRIGAIYGADRTGGTLGKAELRHGHQDRSFLRYY